MMAEGRGWIAPAKEPVKLTCGEAIFLAGKAKERAEWRGYGSGGDWSRGLSRGREYPGVGYLGSEVRAPFVGLLGEYAAQVWLNRRLGRDVAAIDLEFRLTGDQGCDFDLCGLKHEIKTRQSALSPNRVRRATERCAIVPIRSSIYVFAEFTEPYIVNLLGWLWGKQVKKLAVVPAKCAGHANSEFGDEILWPMTRLIKELHRRMT
jgi:hypothetical protein